MPRPRKLKMTEPQTAFLGAGIMGRPMARNLLAAGYPLAVWNRSRDKAAALAEHGALVADSPAAAAEGAQFIFVMVSDGDAADAVLFGADSAMETATAGACVIVSSTLPPQTAKAQAEQCRQFGVDYLDAPVSGGEKGAQDGALAIMVGGEREVYARAEALLRALGRPKRIGESGCGQLAKLANQAIVGATIAAVTEALLLARAGGADIGAVREALSGGFADSTVLQQHGRRMVEADFAPGGPAKYQWRDLQNAVSAAAGGGVETPVTSAAAAMFEEMLAADGDYADLDHSALYQFWKARGPA
ncbi:MAG: NAD(P)-dependent oxidoreductase [Gammaproteobacteria bacterium]|nr:NAD(P)-dependent oxidoreductase [Gammaproteobacteria bacterium]